MQKDPAVCTARHIHHVCIAVPDIDESLALYQRLFGVSEATIEEVPDQGVRATLLKIGGTELELIQATDPKGVVARFVERRGEALHHICFEVEDLPGKLDDLDADGVELIDKEPRQGLAGRIAFIHPRSTRGVLIELVDQESTGR